MSPEERFPVSDWQYEVANGDTRRGYDDWLTAKLEEADGERWLKRVNALNVITKDPKIRAWLEENDPKALEQCEEALK